MTPELWASGLTALAVGALIRVVLPPPARLAPRVRPYLPTGRWGGDAAGDTTMRGLLRAMVEDLARKVGRLLDRMGSAELAVRLRQAGWYTDLGEAERVSAYRMRQLVAVAGWGGGAFGLGSLMGWPLGRVAAVTGLGLVVGATRPRARLERAVEERRRTMRIEVYTIDQLLALRIKAGAGVAQAVSRLVEAGTGQVVGELAEALRLHAGGLPLAEAFRRLAALTPEPACSRTYMLLALGAERGVDLAEGLMGLAEDVREARREEIRRTATRRRAAMLIPTIAILAPVMLLFVGAPLPSLLLGFR